MSFLIDPPLLVGTGAAIGRLIPDDRAARLAEAAMVAGFVTTSASLYANAPWTRAIWTACRAESGRDWMLNSGVFRFDHRRAGPAVHAAAAGILATYPLWARLGVRLGRRRRATTAAPE